MKFTPKNLLTEFPKLEKSAQKQYAQHFELAQTFIEDYDSDADARRAIDMFVKKLNDKFGNKTSPSPPNGKRTKKEKSAATAKVDSAEQVEKVLPEVGFIKRFCTLDGKMVKTSHDSALRILNALQKAIVEKVIRKTSPYATEINAIQGNLIKIIESKGGNAIIEVPEKYKEIAKSQKINIKTAIIKSFIAIQGKEGVMSKARNLFDKNDKILKNSDKKEKELRDIQVFLKNYIDGRTTTIEIETQALQGLYGLAGIEFTPKSGDIVSSTEFLGAQFDTIKLTGKWKSLIGQPDTNFRLMIYGKPGSGKSTLALQFAGYLSKKLGKKVLYVAGEEKFGYTLQEKIIRLDVANINLLTTDRVPSNLERFDVVFIDSVNTLGLEPEQLKKLPKTSAYVYVFQTTKEGLFRGSQEFSHDVDTVIKVENMKAIAEKNRYGGTRQAVVV